MSSGNQMGVVVRLESNETTELINSLYSELNNNDEWYSYNGKYLIISSDDNWKGGNVLFDWKAPMCKSEFVIKLYLYTS